MRYDSLRSPISETDPCGPDLDEIGDQAYGNYMLVASSRLPATFFNGEALFDKSSIDLDDEVQSIDRFLQRSRDIRLLTLEARFQILTGSLIGFSEAVQGLAIIVSEFWDHFLPLPYDGDHMLRQNTVEGLDDPVQILPPLQYAPIVVGTGSLPTVTYRNYIVAEGKAKPRGNEEMLKLDAIIKTLGDDSTVGRVTESHEAIQAAIAALKLIRNTFIQHAGHEFAPNYDRLNGLLASMDELIVRHRPSLAPAKPVTGDGEVSDAGEASEASAAAATATTKMPNHLAARTALQAAEAYFRRMEPSSPALILVHQAAALIGRPLVEALAALMPAGSAKAMFRFVGSYEFDIDFGRMKLITDEALATPLPELPPLDPPTPPIAAEARPPQTQIPGLDPGLDGAPGPTGDGQEGVSPIPAQTAPMIVVPTAPEANPVFVARTRADAAGLILSAEAFFRQAEPSSPIPLLLERARDYLNRDFASIMNELAPKERPK